MVYDICCFLIKRYLRKNKVQKLEVVISCDGVSMRKRNFKREESVKETLSKIR